MVDEVRVLRLLRAVSDDLAVLRRAATARAEQRAEPLWLRGVKYTFVTAIEARIVDDQIVLARLNDPSDLEQFSGQVARWLGR